MPRGGDKWGKIRRKIGNFLAHPTKSAGELIESLSFCLCVCASRGAVMPSVYAFSLRILFMCCLMSVRKKMKITTEHHS